MKLRENTTMMDGLMMIGLYLFIGICIGMALGISVTLAIGGL